MRVFRFHGAPNVLRYQLGWMMDSILFSLLAGNVFGFWIPSTNYHTISPPYYSCYPRLGRVDSSRSSSSSSEHETSVWSSWVSRAKQDMSHVATEYSPFGHPSKKKNKKMEPQLVSASEEWRRLERHAAQVIQSTHLRELLSDPIRCQSLFVEHDGVYFDYTRQRVTLETMELLMQLAYRQDLPKRIQQMMSGEHINFTEDRPVLHTALRASPTQSVLVTEGDRTYDAVQEVHQVLQQIRLFTQGIRSGAIRGYTGKRLRNFVSVGIGGSYLGPSFLHECLKTDPDGVTSSLGYTLRFLANIDPIDVKRACADLDPEETLIIIVSKTFTTSETMLNARTMRQWLWDFMGDHADVVRKHFIACASISSLSKVQEFGIDTHNYFFRFWDWVSIKKFILLLNSEGASMILLPLLYPVRYLL
jgi:glucose-6-phosphate isomerase